MEGTKENCQRNGVMAKHNIKDCVFTNMFGDKKYLLQMYRIF